MANATLLRQTLQHIKDHPEEHNQLHWFARTGCGTTACFAGRAVLLSGYEPADWEPLVDSRRQVTSWATPLDAEDPHRERELVRVIAREKLGLTYGQATWLFDWAQTVEDLELIVEEIITAHEAAAAVAR